MSADLSIQARACWLFIRNEGGWWTAAELAREFGDGDDINAWIQPLAALERRGHLARAPHTLKPAYGVTRHCLPIAGETLEPRIAAA